MPFLSKYNILQDSENEMRIRELMEDNTDYEKQNRETLKQTGFWGTQGAGCLIFCKENGKFLFPKRSFAVEQPGTYGTWGGAIDGNISPEDAVKQEVHEEAGYNGNMKLIPLFIFKKDNFRYYNFLAIVDNVFTPKLNWETESTVWTTLDNLPEPLHFGVKGVLNDPKSYEILKKVQEAYS